MDDINAADEGDFTFIKELDLGTENPYLLTTLPEVYRICDEHKFWDFFRDCPPPSRHHYLWWHPRNIHYNRWRPVYEIFDKQLIKKHHLTGEQFNYHMELLQFIAKHGWEYAKNAIKKYDMDFIVE